MPSHLVVSLELPLPIRRGKHGIPALSDAARQQLRALLRLRLDRDPALAARVLRGRKINDMTKEALWDACLSAGLRLSVTPGPDAPPKQTAMDLPEAGGRPDHTALGAATYGFFAAIKEAFGERA